ncbi:DUF502 domain-containing protein [Fodinisporobacter ferrooxydans]|uniref:DUF502 domain-containing protein n=1 Tax=Fodinisporobacter ferrooxydans TaxID=2901836 RepID=A0ABY4CIG1_9BACL|nr:DUF502 domain-containing protein [Alicyclobacillaceae bacterium MYW30-H2]
MRRLLKYFLNGIITVVPVCTVIYVVVQLFNFLDSILGRWIRKEIHGEYLPGLGLLVTVFLVTVIGWLATAWFTHRIFEYMDTIMNRIPFVKSLYSMIKDTIQSLVGEKRSFSKVVLVKLPGSDMQAVGFVTTEQLSFLGERYCDSIAVYLPQSFQLAGFTIIVPKESVEVLDIHVEDALKFVIAAGVTNAHPFHHSVDRRSDEPG